MGFTFHVSFGNNSNLIFVENLLHLNKAIQDKFNIITLYNLSVYCKEFEDWIDVEEIESLCDKCKLRVKLTGQDFIVQCNGLENTIQPIFQAFSSLADANNADDFFLLENKVIDSTVPKV